MTDLWQFVRKLSRLLGVTALASWLGFIALTLQYDASRPTEPQSSEGRIYALNNHSHIVYINSAEKCWLNALVGTGAFLFAGGVILDFMQRRRTGRDAWTGTDK